MENIGKQLLLALKKCGNKPLHITISDRNNPQVKWAFPDKGLITNIFQDKNGNIELELDIKTFPGATS